VTNTGYVLEGISMLTMIGQEKSLELKKHVGAIHSSNHLTLIQRKIANALLYNAYDHLMDRNEHQIHIPSLCNLIGYDSKDFRKIKGALIALISTVITAHGMLAQLSLTQVSMALFVVIPIATECVNCSIILSSTVD
jgi:hypothetical protein